MKKLLSILTLLMCFSSGVWADVDLTQGASYDFTTIAKSDIGDILDEDNYWSWNNDNNYYQNNNYKPTTATAFMASSTNEIAAFAGLKCITGSSTGRVRIYTDGKGLYFNSTNAKLVFPSLKKDQVITIAYANVSSSEAGFTVTNASANQNTSTHVETLTVSADGDVTVTYKSNKFYIKTINITSAAPAGLSIKTQPQSAVYSVDATATALTVVAQNGTEPYNYQWYSCSDAEKTNPQAVGTNSASYTPSTAATGTFYYYCKVTDSATPTHAEVESNVATITVNPKSNACKLYEAKYSNGFNAFINEEAKTVTVYYMAGEDAPTVTGTPDVSTGATIDNSNPAQIVVTAEDGTTNATYAVTRTAVTPYNGDGVEFDGSETWVKTGNGYLTTKDDKTYYAWVINRQVKDGTTRDEDPRVALGKTRIYFFVDGAHSIRLYNERGSALNTARDIKVYVNGVLQASPTSMGAWKSDTKPSITIAAGNVPAMIEISSDQKSGDTGWGRIEVIKNKSVEVTDTKWATATTPNWPVSFDENATVYVVASAEGSIKLTQISDAPANTPIIVNAASAGSYTMIPKSEAATIETNLLTSATGTETGDGNGNYYVLGITSKGVGFGKLAGGVTLAKGKAFIPGSAWTSSKDFLPFVIGDEENETTSINSIENGESRIENSDYIYNLAGQKVSKDYKGIVIVNGKKVIRK